MIQSKNVVKLMVVLILHVTLIGCMPSNVRVQVPDKTLVMPFKTDLVAGLKKMEDKRPEEEKAKDAVYEKPSPVVINEKLHRDLKLSGLFREVLLEDFDRDKVDVVIDPEVNHFYYNENFTGWSAFSLLMALTGFPGLIYLLAGGPAGEHYGEASLGLKMSTSDGRELAVGSADKSYRQISNIHNTSSGLGVAEGQALSEASYELLLSLSKTIKIDDLALLEKPKKTFCGSDMDCKGDRICVEGKCMDQVIQ